MTAVDYKAVGDKKILLTGSDGQLGYELQRCAPDNYLISPCDIDQLDITDTSAVLSLVRDLKPDIIINAAAYTAVDKAEQDAGTAWAVNHQGSENLARAAVECGARMVQISTDFVFSGKQSRPYRPEDTPGPTGVYGASKQAGDNAVLKILDGKALIVRTSWLYSAHGQNFVKTMLRLMVEREQLGIVADQAGTPTWAATLAACLWDLIELEAEGIFHCADNGMASWYDFALAIQEEAVNQGLLQRAISILPIRTEDYPTPATRPSYSVLDKVSTEQVINRKLPHWRESLRNMLKEL